MGTVAGTASAIRLPWHDALLRLDNERTVQARSQTIAETNPLQTADQVGTSQEVARQPAQDGRIDGTVMNGRLNHCAVPGRIRHLQLFGDYCKRMLMNTLRLWSRRDRTEREDVDHLVAIHRPKASIRHH